MKIGILTFHSQLNYGGVLQCYALQQVLIDMGHDVVVIDRWFERDDVKSLQVSVDITVGRFVTWILKSLWGSRRFEVWLRARKTQKFIQRHLHLTNYHFIDWQDAPKQLGVDMLVVGSDQVWHCGNWGDPRPYLLDGAPECPAIAYAVSLGMSVIPESFRAVFKDGLRRFGAISVREQSACDILTEFGFKSEIVLDPTMLVAASEWMGRRQFRRSAKRRLVCYFMVDSEVDLRNALLPLLESVDWEVDVFMSLQVTTVSDRSLRAMFRSVWTRFNSRVRFRFSASPQDFVELFKDADFVITDSFHALMFATIFRKNIRILIPKSEVLRISFSRIQDFVSEYVRGAIYAETIDEAYHSLVSGESVTYDLEALSNSQARSLEWLRTQLKGINDHDRK